MIKLIIYIIIFVLSFGLSPILLSQGVTLNNNGGKIQNNGTFRVKAGQANINQDTIDGRFEFTAACEAFTQEVPNMVYNQLVLSGKSRKIIDSVWRVKGVKIPVTTRDSLLLLDSARVWLFAEGINAQGAVKNEAIVSATKELQLIGQRNQDIWGKGNFPFLTLNNDSGATVIKEGGFRIDRRLSLLKGDLRNSFSSNFKMADSSIIVRNAGTSLVFEPEFEGVVTVKYQGAGNIATSGEIPTDKKTLKSLYIENDGELTLTKNTTVNDSLVISAKVIALNDTLELANRSNPIFNLLNPNLEIVGNFKRSVIIPGDSLVLNNPWTWVRFSSLADLGQIKAITSTIYPSQFQPYPEGEFKVKRRYNISAYNENNTEIFAGFRAQFGYGWRYAPSQTIDENNDLDILQLVIQRWDANNWTDYSSTVPNIDLPANWAYGRTDSLNRSGFFAVGGPNLTPLVFRAYTLLEGPYIASSKSLMGVELWNRNLLKDVNLNEYPLNLIPDLASVLPTQIPDSVVDYAILEFREQRNSEAAFRKPIFIRYDGRLVDLFGNDRIRLNGTQGLDPNGGKYYVVVRHRNHAPVITQEPLEISKNTSTLVYNFTDPQLIEGGTTSLRLVDLVNDEKIYAMKGGFIPYTANDLKGLMDVTLYYTNPDFWKESWKQFTNIGYINVDYNLSGIVTTKDFNISWNNRGQ